MSAVAEAVVAEDGDAGFWRERAAQLQRALETRIVIEQAKGALSVHLGVTPDEAFEVLRAACRRRRSRIHDEAATIVAAGVVPSHVAAEFHRRRAVYAAAEAGAADRRLGQQPGR